MTVGCLVCTKLIQSMYNSLKVKKIKLGRIRNFEFEASFLENFGEISREFFGEIFSTFLRDFLKYMFL